MSHIPYTITDNSISLFFKGKMHNVPKTDPNFRDIRVQLLDRGTPDHDAIDRLLNPVKTIQKTAGNDVRIDEQRQKIYFQDLEVNNTLSTKLLKVLAEGADATPWVNFMQNVMENPSHRSRECLFNFLEAFSAPLTDDGHFIAFKRVRGNYKDIHSGKFDNSPGQVVEMDREKVNPDPNVTCSHGLHVCATSYLGDFYASCSDSRVVAVKVNPRDVVAVPGDYRFSKMRCCRYEVLCDADESRIKYWDKVARA